jgi:general secretion pathway protein B
MSYILDALKKANAERERHHVPDLNAHKIDADGTPGAGSVSRTAAAGGALALIACAALVTWWFTRVEAPEVAPSSPAPATTAPVAAVAALPPGGPGTPVPAVAPVAPPATEPAPVIVPPAPPKTALATAGASAPERVPTYAELPPDVRSRLPALAVNGAVYAPNASGRMVFINGQVLREGDQAAEGVTVERIGPKSTLLSWHGTRFELRN